MLDNLIFYDHKIFIFINIYLSNPIFDIIMPLFDNPNNWLIPIIVFWITLCYKDKNNRFKLFVASSDTPTT